MLTDEERHEIAVEAARYPDRRAVSIEALKIAQRSRGFISDETLAELAAHLGMTVDELDAVATFYNMIFRRPVGRHVLFLCDSVSCWVMGEPALCAHLRARLGVELGQTSADGEYTLLPVACLGVCERAPALLCDGEVHDELTTEKLDLLLGRRS